MGYHGGYTTHRLHWTILVFAFVTLGLVKYRYMCYVGADHGVAQLQQEGFSQTYWPKFPHVAIFPVRRSDDLSRIYSNANHYPFAVCAVSKLLSVRQIFISNSPMTTAPNMYSSIYWGGVFLEVKRPIENFWFLAKNADIWRQLFYHSISVTNGITKTAKERHMMRESHCSSLTCSPPHYLPVASPVPVPVLPNSPVPSPVPRPVLCAPSVLLPKPVFKPNVGAPSE